MKEQIIKILESYIVDNIGETSPKIDIDTIPSIADEILSLQLQQAGVSISLERAKKYARHQHYVGTQQLEFVEFEDWAKD